MVSDFRILAAQIALEFEDTFVDGTDDPANRPVDVSDIYSFDDIAATIDEGLSGEHDKVIIHAGVLRFLIKDHARLRETIGKIYDLLGY